METQQIPPSRVIGSIFLVAGCCIGAGMLGLPIVTGLGGFRPTFFFFFLCWLFMATTGLLFLEVNLWFKEEVSIVTMAHETLGTVGKVAGGVLFSFLFYSLMVAYAAGGGQLFAEFLEKGVGIVIPEWMGSLVLSLFFGVFLYLGTQVVDNFNRLLMLGLIGSYFLLIGVGSEHVNPKFLEHADYGVAIFAIPVMIISFGFHNLVPTLTTYLNHDVKKLRFTLLVGSALPLVFYMMWEWLILGIIPAHGDNGFGQMIQNQDMATRALSNIVGGAWVAVAAQYFAFFAIVTSFLSVALSFVDFLADGLHIKKCGKGKLLLCFLSLFPPFIFSTLYPKIFTLALRYAGAFGAVLLFGVLPACMVWRGRYCEKREGKPLVPGGRATLIVIILFSFAVVGLELFHQFGASG